MQGGPASLSAASHAAIARALRAADAAAASCSAIMWHSRAPRASLRVGNWVKRALWGDEQPEPHLLDVGRLHCWAARAIARSWRRYEAHHWTKLDELRAATAITAGWRRRVARRGDQPNPASSPPLGPYEASDLASPPLEPCEAFDPASLPPAPCEPPSPTSPLPEPGKTVHFASPPPEPCEAPDPASPPQEPCEQPHPAYTPPRRHPSRVRGIRPRLLVAARA